MRRGNIYIFEALMSGFYVNITRSLIPIFLATVGFSVSEIVKLNFYAYLLATAVAYVMFKVRHIFLRNTKRFLLLFYIFERIFWGLIPLSQFFNALPICYAIAVAFTIPTSSLLNIAIFSLEKNELKRVMYLRSSLGAFSNIIGSVTAILVLWSLEGLEKYVSLYALASVVGLVSSVLLLSVDVKSVEVRDVHIDIKIKSVNIFLFLLLVASSSAIIGSVWFPHLMIDFGVKDYFVALLSLIQTATSVFSPLFWAGRSYKSFRFAIVLASAVPILIATVNVPELHILIAVIYAFSFNGSNMLASFLFAEISNAKDVLAFMTVLSSSLSQLFGMAIALLLGDLNAMLASSTLLLTTALILSTLAIPEVSIDVEKARIYSRIVYNVTISGYAFSTTVAKETSLLAIRLTVLFLALTTLIFIYRVVYYLSL